MKRKRKKIKKPSIFSKILMGIGGISVVFGFFNNTNPFDIGIGLVLIFIGFLLFNKWIFWFVLHRVTLRRGLSSKVKLFYYLNLLGRIEIHKIV